MLSVIYACSVNWQSSGFAIPKISACWALEPRNSGHLQESLDSNVGAFLRLYYYDRVGVMLTDKAADSLFRKSARVGRSSIVTPAILKKAHSERYEPFCYL